MRGRLVFFVPVVVVLGLVGVFFLALQRDDLGEVQSVLIGTVVRPFDIRGLADADAAAEISALSDRDLKQGTMSVVNFWASWCAPCQIEHPQLMALAERDGVQLYGINYKDEDEKARAFLEKLGDPFERVGVDEEGRVWIDWGLTGVPETFVIDGGGRIVMKHIGPLTEEDIEEKVIPALGMAAR